MTKILLLSDTHGFLNPKILPYLKEVDEIWHAGDIGDFSVTDTLKKYKPLKAVYGNIDDFKMRSEFPLHIFFQVEEVTIFLTHIGGTFGKYTPDIQKILIQKKPKIFVCGHSHILKIKYDKKFDVLYLNPGACGKIGFHQVCTLVRFEIDKKNIQNMEIIELKKRY